MKLKTRLRKILHSKSLVGLIAFGLGASAVLLAQSSDQKPSQTDEEPSTPFRLKYGPLQKQPLKKQSDVDSLFDQFYQNHFFGQTLDPFEEMRKMREEMLKDFEHPNTGQGMFNRWYQKKFGGGNVGEVQKREDSKFVYYDIHIEGLDKDKLKFNVEDGQINISGQTEKKSEENQSQTYFSSSFRRSFPVPHGVDASKMQLDQTKDVLTLKFPKID